MPTPTAPSFPGLPVLDRPRGLNPPFLSPSLIVPIDSSDPYKIIGDQYAAQLSPTRSTLSVFDVPSDPGKTCNLVFALPPSYDPHYAAPYTLNSPGGIIVSRLDHPATKDTSTATVANAQSVGDVPALTPGNTYLIGSAPCEAGQKVGYRIDSIGGLDLSFFQMSSPALGLFMEVS